MKPYFKTGIHSPDCSGILFPTRNEEKKDRAESGIKLLEKLIFFFFLFKEFHDEIPPKKQAKNQYRNPPVRGFV